MAAAQHAPPATPGDSHTLPGDSGTSDGDSADPTSPDPPPQGPDSRIPVALPDRLPPPGRLDVGVDRGVDAWLAWEQVG